MYKYRYGGVSFASGFNDYRGPLAHKFMIFNAFIFCQISLPCLPCPGCFSQFWNKKNAQNETRVSFLMKRPFDHHYDFLGATYSIVRTTW